MKFTVVYDSKTGNTKQAAEWIAEGMNSVAGVQALAFQIPSVDADWVNDSKGIVAGSPSYGTLITPDMHGWLLGGLGTLSVAGKLGGAFATEQYTHGGATLVIQQILQIEMLNGMLCYSGGKACGKPFIHLGPVAVNNNVEQHNGIDFYKENFVAYGKRFAQMGMELFA